MKYILGGYIHNQENNKRKKHLKRIIQYEPYTHNIFN